MNTRKHWPKLTPTRNINKYVPGELVLSSKHKDWDSIHLNVFSFSSCLTESPTPPAVPDYIFSFRHAGYSKANYSVNSKPWQACRLITDNIIMLPPYHTISLNWDSTEIENPIIASNLYLPSRIMSDAASRALDTDSVHIELQQRINTQDSFIKQIILSLNTETERDNPYGRLFAETASQLLAIYLLKNYCTVRHKIPEFKRGLPDWHLQQAIDYIHSHLNQDISLQSLANIGDLSSYHFARLFKQSIGVAPHQYVMQCRMERAKQLLKHTDWSVVHIAIELGYQSQSHFTRLFKRYTNLTPLAYRRQVIR